MFGIYYTGGEMAEKRWVFEWFFFLNVFLIVRLGGPIGGRRV